MSALLLGAPTALLFVAPGGVTTDLVRHLVRMRVGVNEVELGLYGLDESDVRARLDAFKRGPARTVLSVVEVES